RRVPLSPYILPARAPPEGWRGGGGMGDLHSGREDAGPARWARREETRLSVILVQWRDRTSAVCHRGYRPQLDEPSVSRLLPLLLPAALLAALMGPASAGASAPAVLVTDSRMTRMVALMDRGASCMPSSDRAYIRRVVLEAPSHMVREMSDAGMDSLMEVCKQHRRGLPGGIIFPGTKWCGTGNIAVGYHDLGEKEAEDSCCREHDNCPSQLGPGECRGGLCNNTPFTT
ncbi:Phospholipase A(2), partial [Gryllus bimaculatus]